ncbi:MAG: GGDEF domain-containing protein [Gammaproteobacteria bacterium]|nr:GGDEF domain-containing protein [Gammaproteobacteria bacterium]
MNAADDTNSEKAAEYLRLTLPLMSRHHVPAIPHNYAVWYTYVSGENPALCEEIDRLIGAGEAFTPSVNAHLYRRFISEQDLGEVEQVRSELGVLIQEVSTSLRNAGKDAQAFEGVLDNFAGDVSDCSDLKSISSLIGELIDETRNMRSNTTTLHVHFEEKSREIENLQEQLQAERQRALSDPLTGLYNRTALFEHIETAIAAAEPAMPPSLIMFDIDHFKRINDTHGHLIGDRVIRFVAQTLQKNIKGQDTAARFGGEEFTVLLPNTPANGAMAVAQTIRRIIETAQLVRADNKKPLGDITISAGVATFRNGEDVMDFIDRADRALYRSKKDGRNRVSAAG